MGAWRDRRGRRPGPRSGSGGAVGALWGMVEGEGGGAARLFHSVKGENPEGMPSRIFDGTTLDQIRFCYWNIPSIFLGKAVGILVSNKWPEKYSVRSECLSKSWIGWILKIKRFPTHPKRFDCSSSIYRCISLVSIARQKAIPCNFEVACVICAALSIHSYLLCRIYAVC